MQGWNDSELTETGIKNAIALGNRLKEIDFQSIYASPSKRTVKTASFIIGGKNQPIIEDENLREINLGEWEGQTHDYLKQNYSKEYHAFWNTPHLYNANTGESFSRLQERVANFLKRILSEHDDGNILVVTHTVFIKALLLHCKMLSIEELWTPPFIYDTSLTIIEVKDRELEIKLEGDITHRNIHES